MIAELRERWLIVLIGGLIVTVLAVVAFTFTPTPAPVVADPTITVVAVGSDDTTAAVTFTGDHADALHGIGEANGSVELSLTSGSTVVDFAPRYGRGNEIDQSPERRAAAIDAAVDDLAASINEADGSQRAVLEALDRATAADATEVWLIANPLSLANPADFRLTGLGGVTPEELTANVTAAGFLPDLGGKQLRFLAVPASGEQERLRPVDRQWVEAVWLAVMRAAGADASFTWLDGAEPASTVPGQVIPVPSVTTVAGGRCRLDASFAFRPDTAEFVSDRTEVAGGLTECVSTLAPTGQILVTGHVAKVEPECVPCGVDLSRQRAEAVASILIDLGVDPTRLEVQGLGSAAPLDPAQPDAAVNRRVEIESAS